MQLAMIGLGRMGGNMVRRLVQGGHEVIVYDQSAAVALMEWLTSPPAQHDRSPWPFDSRT